MLKERLTGYPRDARMEEVLAAAEAGQVLPDGERLLRESRQLRRAENSRDLWQTLPFRMVCETWYGKKEGYQELISQFQEIKERDYERLFSETCKGDREAAREMACFLAACVDTLEFISMEIYEQYRYLADLIKSTVRVLAKDLVRSGRMAGLDREAAEALGASVLKACRLKAVSREKYEADGLALLERGRL